MKRQKWAEGSIVKIDMGDGTYCFGQCISDPILGFFDLRTADVPPVEEIAKYGFLFCVWVMRYAVTQGIWEKIGKAPFDRKAVESLKFFKQDSISGRFYIYDPVTDIPVSYEDTIGLERAAAWEPEHIEDRLRDHFAGRPNVWVESMKPRLN
ncbi:immunity 26/phosphotriesterase HocA family protein [Hoeflea sp.]|uniref:immunity 26/phosphotriesterase HocA family protein n=1 Tax=Hoeflea sp. TaxID=1940281 RepID=UPI0019AB57D5|nr:immunity 26/phosphotriesterase HocA family protein [Hoeflea sp.]MBC7285150.1 immunity 26/phosphotriesterase HocA family protein [Hoeflea sp.]